MNNRYILRINKPLTSIESHSAFCIFMSNVNIMIISFYGNMYKKSMCLCVHINVYIGTVV